MFNNLQKVDHELSNELRMSRIMLQLSPPKGGSENAILMFYEYNWHSLDKTLIESFFALKRLDKALILPLMPHIGWVENAILWFCE